MDWASFPPPPRMSGNGKIINFLHWMAAHEQTKGATHRAKELREIAEWLSALATWLKAQKASERTGA